MQFLGSINVANAEGKTLDGLGGGALLAGTTALDLGLAPGVGIADLAAAAGDATTLSANDGRNARAFADLRSQSGLDTALADLVVGLAGGVRAAKGAAGAARAIATGAELARVSEHGVSIDEEMVSLVRYQRALEAASRVMTTVDEALEVLVNRTGIVGR